MCLSALFGAKVKTPKFTPAPPAPPPAAPLATGIKVEDPSTSTTAQGAQGELLNQGLTSSSLRVPRSTTMTPASSSLGIPTTN